MSLTLTLTHTVIYPILQMLSRCLVTGNFVENFGSYIDFQSVHNSTGCLWMSVGRGRGGAGFGIIAKLNNTYSKFRYQFCAF